MNSPSHIHQIPYDQYSKCPKCQHASLSSSQSSASSSTDSHIYVPIRRPNDQSHIQITLLNLKKQIQILKRSNIQKDRVIHKLTKTIENSQGRADQELGETKRQVKRLKQDLRRLVVAKTQYTNNELNAHGSVQYIDDYLMRDNQHRYGNNNNEQKYKKMKSQSRSHKTENIQYVQQMKQVNVLQRKLTKLKEQNRWMVNFMNSFIEMMIGFSKKYKEDIFSMEWSLKKKAKVGWRYLKHLIKFWLEEQ